MTKQKSHLRAVIRQQRGHLRFRSMQTINFEPAGAPPGGLFRRHDERVRVAVGLESGSGRFGSRHVRVPAGAHPIE